MGIPFRCRQAGWPAVCALLLLVLTGCQTVHSVKVDAINDPSKATGTAYRLEMFDPTGSQSEEVGAMVQSIVRDALGARGMYETPRGVPPDIVITAEYGVGPGQMQIQYNSGATILTSMGAVGGGSAKPVLVHEKFIKLTARLPGQAAPVPAGPTRRGSQKRGEEIWSVQVSVEDERKELPRYLPVLASVMVDYIGTNTGEEKHLQVDEAKAINDLRTRISSTAAPASQAR